jgi:hypothetical protein
MRIIDYAKNKPLIKTGRKNEINKKEKLYRFSLLFDAIMIS